MNLDIKGRFQRLVYVCLEHLTVILFHLIRAQYKCKAINYPNFKCMFALWHAHQCGVYTCQVEGKKTANRDTVIMVSGSKEGKIISRAANAMGVKTIKGSFARSGAQASLEMIRKIKEENMNGALTIDGPRGPNRVVKKGIIEIAKLSGVPIVPAVWWSPDKTFLKFNSWDKFTFPWFGTQLVMLFGDPIEVPSQLNDEEVEKIRQKIEDDLNKLYVDLKENYNKYLTGK